MMTQFYNHDSNVNSGKRHKTMTQTQTQVKDTPIFSQTSWLKGTVYKEQKEYISYAI